MDEHEFEDRLKTRLHARFDRAEPLDSLRARVSNAVGEATPRARRPLTLRALIAVAAVVVIAVAIGLSGVLGQGVRPGSTLPAVSSPSVTTSARPGSTPSLAPLPGSMPPISTNAWRGLSLALLAAGPTNAFSVTAWSGGYLALPSIDDPAIPTTVWISRNGRDWTTLPGDVFGPPGLSGGLDAEEGAPCRSGVLVASLGPPGVTTIWSSSDGQNWSSSSAPDLRWSDSTIVGNSSGAVAALQIGSSNQLLVTSDCARWQAVSLPGATSDTTITGLASFGTGFVAVDASGTESTSSPMAWISNDGVHWSEAAVAKRPGDAFFDVEAGSKGLVAESASAAVPNLNALWSSTDGLTWTVNPDPPIGTRPTGEGVGDLNGAFTGDGTRILVHGTRSDGALTEYWTSFDGLHWTELTLSGDAGGALGGTSRPLLLRDGVLFDDGTRTWYGAAVK